MMLRTIAWNRGLGRTYTDEKRVCVAMRSMRTGGRKHLEELTIDLRSTRKQLPT